MNYLYYKSNKWGKTHNWNTNRRFIIKKQSISNERKDPLFYSFKNTNYHNKKLFSNSLRSFQGNQSDRLMNKYQDENNLNPYDKKDDKKDSLNKVNSNKPNKTNDIQHNEDKMQEIEEKEKKDRGDEFIDYDNDIRLEIALQKLGLDDLIHVFNNFNITFNDLLFLEKDDLDEMQLHLYQKNRLLTFISEYTQDSSQYTIGEILIFFNNNPKYKTLAQNNRE